MNKRKARVPLRAILLAAASTSSSAFYIPPPSNSLFERVSSSCPASFSPCQQAGLPSDFCCQAGSTCDVLAGNTTVLCCPAGQDCSKINPITCDITQQDASAHPTAPIKTTALNGVLPHCGDGTCCPFGFSCNGLDQCVQNENQNAAPLQGSAPASSSSSSSPSAPVGPSSSAAASTTSVPSAPASVVPTSAAPTSATSTNTAAQESSIVSQDNTSNGPQTASIIGGVVGGIAFLVIAGIGVCLFLGHRKKRTQQDSMKLNRSTSSFGNIINNPLAISSPKLENESSAFRTDFIRKSPFATPEASPRGGRRPGVPRDSRFIATGPVRPRSTAENSFNSTELNGTYMPDMPETPSASHPSPARPRTRDSVQIPPIRGMRLPPPVTPRAQREPSMEINVFADPITVAGGGGSATTTSTSNGADFLAPPSRARSDSGDRNTTFEDLLEAAHLGNVLNGSPFVPASAQSSPASRRR